MSGVYLLERVTGIEPALKAWEALILPLNYTRETFFYISVIQNKNQAILLSINKFILQQLCNFCGKIKFIISDNIIINRIKCA